MSLQLDKDCQQSVCQNPDNCVCVYVCVCVCVCFQVEVGMLGKEKVRKEILC